MEMSEIEQAALNPLPIAFDSFVKYSWTGINGRECEMMIPASHVEHYRIVAAGKAIIHDPLNKFGNCVL